MTRLPFLLALAAIAAPAAAQQQSESYKFLQAVKDAKGEDVVAAVERPGSHILEARDDNGQGALHIVVQRGDRTYLRYLLQHGADPNMRDRQGTTPLLLAVAGGDADMVQTLIQAHANANLGNNAGETPLIRAVQRRDIGLVRALVVGGANPDQRDRVAGLSARDYATRDTRTPALARVMDEKPERPIGAVAGPKL